MHYRQHRLMRNAIWGITWSLLLLTSCGRSALPTLTQAVYPTPTVAPFFQLPTRIPLTLPTPTATQRSIREVDRSQDTTVDQRITEIPIYRDGLDASWGLEMNSGMQYNLASGLYAKEGAVSIAVTPLVDHAKCFFTVKRESTTPYLRSQILGVSFWLNAGPGNIQTDELTVTVVGSNDYTYWSVGDSSVKALDALGPEIPLFPEPHLYDLDIRRPIPRDTWVEVILWLDNQPYDLDYTYVTGVYIKNDHQFMKTFYIDNVNLLVERTSAMK